MSSNVQATFTADAVLFDMDGTLTDSIAAVEAAWGEVAKDIGQDPAFVIAATHGKRAIDNLAQFKPHIQAHEIESAVQAFEESILFFADAYTQHGPASRGLSPLSLSSDALTPALSTGRSTSSSSSDSTSRSPFAGGDDGARSGRRPSSFVRRVSNRLALLSPQGACCEDVFMEEIEIDVTECSKEDVAFQHMFEAWQMEAAAVDRSVRILPGVKKLMDSIPEGRYAVATSGAKTYAYGCMNRVGITPPKVTITACDKRLKAGKPAPDPFLLAASELGFDAKRCVVFEDSPSGIKAGVASGAIVIAVCTSHERSKIENCGAHFIVDTMEQVRIVPEGSGRDMSLKFTVSVRQ